MHAACRHRRRCTAEYAAALSRRAALAAEGRTDAKAEGRFDAAAQATLARVFAREAALKVGQEGLRWVAGAAEPALVLRGLMSIPVPHSACKAMSTAPNTGSWSRAPRR